MRGKLERCSISAVLVFAVLAAAKADADSREKAGEVKPEESWAWYILSQTDTDGLLHGLPQRLGKCIVPSRRKGPMWNGVEGGGRVKLDIRVESDLEGEVFVGFFADPRWWVTQPVQVRRFPGPGNYTVENMIPGKFWVGAMLGVLPEPDALGVHSSWPEPIEIVSGRTTGIQLLVSSGFQNHPGFSGLKRGFSGDWDRMDPSRMITVHTVDAEGKPVPYCRVTFVDRDEKTTRGLHHAGTDDLGYAYCDQIDSTFSLCVQRFDLLPELMGSRWEYKKIRKLYHAQDRPVIVMTWGPFPGGSGKVIGRVHDQHGRALDHYYLTLIRQIGEARGWSDAESYGVTLPVVDAEGRFELGDLAPGTYRVRVRHFDYPTHVYRSTGGPEFTIPEEPAAVVEIDVEVEAKELLYGRAVYDDGTPVHPGGWTAWFERDPTSPSGGEYFALRTEPDGSFRVCLSCEERQKLIANSQGLVDVYAYQPREARTKVHIDKLSQDPKHPAKVVISKPKSDPPEVEAPEENRTAEKGLHDAEEPEVPPSVSRDRCVVADLELVDTNGRTHRLSDYRGRPVLLNLFATSCGPCQQEVPHLTELHQQYADKGLVVLLIALGEKSAEVVENFARRRRPPFPILVDFDRAVKELVDETGQPVFPRDETGGLGLPTNVLLDRDHRVIFADTGFNEHKFAKLQEAVEIILEPSDPSCHGG